MLLNPPSVADGQGGGVDERNPGAGAETALEVGTYRHDDRGQQVREALVADELGELDTQLHGHILAVIRLAIAVVGLMKMDHDGKDFAHAQLATSPSLSGTSHEMLPLVRLKLLIELIDMATQFQ